MECQWRAGLRDAAAVQTIFEHLLRVCPRTAGPLLIDERLASPFKEDAKQWLIEQGLPLLSGRLAYSQVAIIQALDVYTRLSAVAVRATSKDLRLPCRVFGSEAEARSWLSQH